MKRGLLGHGVVNTATSPRESMDHAVLGQNPKAIEDQERRGQAQLVTSDVLPADHRGCEDLEKAGVVFGEPVSGDPLFVQATIPAGWKKVETDHAMWSHLVDETGRVRGEIFYKAASYDRSAFICVARKG